MAKLMLPHCISCPILNSGWHLQLKICWRSAMEGLMLRNPLCCVWMHIIEHGIESVMENQIYQFNRISQILFGCAWYSAIELRFQWNTKSCFDVTYVEIKVFLTLNNISCVICIKIYQYISDVSQYYFSQQQYANNPQ